MFKVMKRLNKTQNKPPQRLKNLIELQNLNDNRISRYAQIKLAEYIWENLKNARQNKSDDALIPSHFFWGDAVKLYINWTLYYNSDSVYRKFGIVDSAFNKIIKWCRILSVGFSEKWIYFRDFEIRKQLSRQLFPPKFCKVTIIVDGTHTLCQFNSRTAKTLYENEMDDVSGEKIGSLVRNDYYSFKLKKGALNNQVAITADLWVPWIAEKSLPAGRWNDLKHFKEHIKSFVCNGEDIVCFDGGYGKIQGINCCVPRRKPRNKELSKLKKEENDEISEFRGDIERKFGTSCNKFGIISNMWRHGEEIYNFEFRKCFALMNAEIKGKYEDDIVLITAKNHPFFSFDEFIMPGNIQDKESESDSESGIYGYKFGLNPEDESKSSEEEILLDMGDDIIDDVNQ